MRAKEQLPEKLLTLRWDVLPIDEGYSAVGNSQKVRIGKCWTTTFAKG